MMVCGKMVKEMDEVFSSYILGTQYFADGGKYDGEWRDDKKSGKGTSFTHLGLYIFSNRERYEGEIEDGIVHGKGNEGGECRFVLLS